MNNHHEQLVERLGFGGSQRLLAILKYLLSPDQAAICAALPGLSRRGGGENRPGCGDGPGQPG